MKKARGHARVKRKTAGHLAKHSSRQRFPAVKLSLYAKKAKQLFEVANHICVEWDQRFHSEDTNIMLCYSWELDKAAWLPLQVMAKTRASEVHDGLLELAVSAKLVRTSSHSQLRALWHALSSLGLDFGQIQAPAKCARTTS